MDAQTKRLLFILSDPYGPYAKAFPQESREARILLKASEASDKSAKELIERVNAELDQLQDPEQGGPP